MPVSSTLVLISAGCAFILTAIVAAKALLFRCTVCRHATWPWQACEPSRFSDTMDQVHTACLTAAAVRSSARNPLARAISA